MDNQWLHTQFTLHPDKTKADLARALGLDRPAISKILAGTRQIKATEYAGMRRFFGLPVDGERAVDRGQSYVIQPLESGLKEPAVAGGADAWVMPASLFAHRTRTAPENIRIFTVQDNAMRPDLMPGETVLVDMADVTPAPPGIFLVSDGLGHIIRQCAPVPQARPPQIRLSALNAQYESYSLSPDRAGIIGRVIAKLQWL
ncbi:MAG: LexA family transcriptional regulator [Alphaproteobacteria bacterium]|nr:LexA family transcriptional regulator [Alphaproteobacteria bacterium]